MAGVHRATGGPSHEEGGTEGPWRVHGGGTEGPPTTGHCTASRRSIPLHDTLMVMLVLVWVLMEPNLRTESFQPVDNAFHDLQ